MIPINYLRNNKEEIINLLNIKNIDSEEIISKILFLDDERKKCQKLLDDKLFESNSIAKEIGVLYKSGEIEKANKLKEKTIVLKIDVKNLQESLEKTEINQHQLLISLPNVPHPSVPKGKTAEDNIIEKSDEEFTKHSDESSPHWDLIKKHDIIDFELGNKVSGAGFPFYKDKGAKLQRALINFFIDKANEAGYTEIQPPIFINKASGYGTGQLPDKDGQMYHMKEDNLYAIPTAEVPITNMFRNVILKQDQLPIKIVAYTPCFRREAGSWGKDVRGLNRLHQFDKVEIVRIEDPEKSYEVLEKMCNHVEHLLSELELPYRKLRLCGGDLSFTSALTFDFEVYSSAQKKWLEVSSVSNFESFQSNRMKLRIKDKDGKTKLAHTLNGSALAIPRIVAALLENNQTKDGINIPKALIKYTGFEKI